MNMNLNVNVNEMKLEWYAMYVKWFQKTIKYLLPTFSFSLYTVGCTYILPQTEKDIMKLSEVFWRIGNFMLSNKPKENWKTTKAMYVLCCAVLLLYSASCYLLTIKYLFNGWKLVYPFDLFWGFSLFIRFYVWLDHT